MFHFETQGVKKQPRLRDIEGVKCSLKGIENKKNA